MIHVVNMTSGRESALVHELIQPAIHHVDGKGRQQWQWWWGVWYSGGCDLFAFDTKGPPFCWLAGPSAPSSTTPGPLLAGPVGEDLCPDNLFPCCCLGKGRSIQLLASPWEPEDPPTVLTLELATALMFYKQAGRSLTPITSWMRYSAGQWFKGDCTQVGHHPLSPHPPWCTNPLTASLSSLASRNTSLTSVAWLTYPDRVTNIVLEIPVAMQPLDSGGGRHCYPDLCFRWRQRATVVVELMYLRWLLAWLSGGL
jgi:hypothetical protein